MLNSKGSLPETKMFNMKKVRSKKKMEDEQDQKLSNFDC